MTDDNAEITKEQILNKLNEICNNRGILVTFAIDDFQYKVSTLKSETCSCVIITNAQKGDSWSFSKKC